MSSSESDRPQLLPPVPLERRHDPSEFSSGEPELDDWIKTTALGAHRGGSARVFVTTFPDNVTIVGYYSLSAASVQRDQADLRLAQGMPNPIPMILLGRLAVHGECQGLGVGTDLLQDAVLRMMAAAETIGARGLLVHAIHDRARDWYVSHGFTQSPTDPLHVMALLKDLRRSQRGP